MPVLVLRNGRQMLYFRFVAGVEQTSLKLPLIGKGTMDILEHGRTLCQKEINEGIFRNLLRFFQKSDKFSRINPLHSTVRVRFQTLSVDNFIQRIIRRNFADEKHNKMENRRKMQRAVAASKSGKEEEYDEILHLAITVIETSRLHIAKQLNSVTMSSYWEIGKLLYERKVESKHGESIIKRLATDLKSKYPDMGLSPRNLWDMKRFYLRYCKNDKKVRQAVAVLPWSHNRGYPQDAGSRTGNRSGLCHHGDDQRRDRSHAVVRSISLLPRNGSRASDVRFETRACAREREGEQERAKA